MTTIAKKWIMPRKKEILNQTGFNSVLSRSRELIFRFLTIKIKSVHLLIREQKMVLLYKQAIPYLVCQKETLHLLYSNPTRH